MSGGDIKLALQGYNFGNGYISWAKTNYGGYSYANAVEFSTQQAQRLGWDSYGDTFATRMCESGLNVKVVQSVLGHADVTTTLDIYVTVTNDLKKREITAFETYLKTGAKQMANV